MTRWIVHICMAFTLTTGCRQDFDITTDYVETPVVYGLLDASDSIHYVRIQRAFLDTNTSALQVATRFDSIYYPDVLAVSIRDDSTGQLYPFERIEGDSVGLPKSPGIFNNDHNILYRLQAILNPSHAYTLQVDHLQQGWRLTSNTILVGEIASIVPDAQYVANWQGTTDELIGLAWKRTDNALVYDLQAYFDYWEYPNSAPGDSILHTIPFTLLKASVANLVAPDFIVTHTYATRAFFQEIAAQIPIDTTVVRKAQQIRFTLSAGGEALGMWVANQQVQQGITAGNNLTTYTNIEGGIGIFSSRSQESFTSPIGRRMLDSLQYGQVTRHIGFRH